ncbi:hypothetical protein [Microbacterium sp.]|uniref:hypothetical protein n=1 Tax=Microbacterium sp. TaxID=51671 RepID=UPI0028A8B534|nr:hypothetical protein [Microbacterium sp.]
MVDDGIKYETRTVKAVRGMEARTAKKWEEQGWEVVSQTVGKLTSKLTIRRPKPKMPWRLFAGLGAFIVALIIFALVMSNIAGSDKAEPAGTPQPTTRASAEPSTRPSATPTTEPLQTSEPAKIIDTTVDELLDRLNSVDLGGIQVGDQFRVTGELVGSEYWITGATGDYAIALNAHDGADDLMILLEDKADADEWTDGTRVQLILENVEKTIDGETDDGWMQVLSATVVP